LQITTRRAKVGPSPSRCGELGQFWGEDGVVPSKVLTYLKIKEEGSREARLLTVKRLRLL
jgi:hypothetical protein